MAYCRKHDNTKNQAKYEYMNSKSSLLLHDTEQKESSKFVSRDLQSSPSTIYLIKQGRKKTVSRGRHQLYGYHFQVKAG